MKPNYYFLLFLSITISFKIFAQKKPIAAKEAAWITVSQYDYNNNKLDHEAEDGYVDLIYEEQLSVEKQSHYCKRAMKILTEAGIQNSSEVSIDFDPSYQQLIFHTIKIIRGNSVLNQLNLSKIKTIQREKELDKFMYDGSLSSVLFLEDVRKGDIVEYSYTINGFNPIFKGKFSTILQTNFSVPVYNMYYKLVIPAERKITIKNSKTDIQPAEKNEGDQTVYEWKLNNIKALHTQDNVPAWYDPYSSIMISEYQNWKEVNDWAIELFAIPKNISPSLQKKISEIKLKSSFQEQQTLEALRFVQDDIRYMGIEMGTNSHKPNHPNKVFAQRFGDCKDKSYLLCTILNGLGIECSPVLINTDWKKAIVDWLPSPKSFNHVTVRAKLKDGYHWFDPTISFQRGSIKDISYPDYQCGLVINENTNDLTAIKLKEPGMVRVKEVFDIKNTSDSVRFVVTTNYSGSFADNVRNSFNSMSNYQLLKDYRSYYLDYYKDILADSLNYKDDENTGIFTTKEYYTIPNIWELKNGTKKTSFSSYVIDGIIKKPKETARTMPFSLQYPAHYHEEIEINIPDDWNAEQSLNNLKNDGFKMLANFYYSNKKFLLEYEYENLKDHISTSEVKQYLTDLNKKEETLSYELTQNDKPLLKTSKTNNSGNGYLYAKLLALLVIVGIIIEWRRRR